MIYATDRRLTMIEITGMTKYILIQFSQTFAPSLQFEHMSIFFLPLRILLLNFLYSSFAQICLKVCCFRSPSLCCASLSKQHGATRPSQVITGSCHNRQQWFASCPLNS